MLGTRCAVWRRGFLLQVEGYALGESIVVFNFSEQKVEVTQRSGSLTSCRVSGEVWR